MKSQSQLLADRYMAESDARFAARSQERDARRNANPALYAARRAAIGWGPKPATPAEPTPSQLPGYRLHLSIDAITDAILEMRSEKQRAANHNQDERNAIKSAFNRTFADVGLRLVNIPGWSRYERVIMNSRLA